MATTADPERQGLVLLTLAILSALSLVLSAFVLTTSQILIPVELRSKRLSVMSPLFGESITGERGIKKDTTAQQR